jgi:hypothetical protein
MRRNVIDLPVRQRGNGLKCLDKINARECLEAAVALITVYIFDETDEDLNFLIDLLLFRYIFITYERETIPYPVRNRYFRRARNIDTAECRILFRFDQDELIQLLEAWQVPPTIICSNRSVFKREEAFLLMLCRLASPSRFITMEAFWGRDNSQLCRGFNAALFYFFNLHADKVTNKTKN